MFYLAWKRGLPWKFACFVLFCPIKKLSFNLLCVLDLFFRMLAVNSASDFFLPLWEVIPNWSVSAVLKVEGERRKSWSFVSNRGPVFQDTVAQVDYDKNTLQDDYGCGNNMLTNLIINENNRHKQILIRLFSWTRKQDTQQQQKRKKKKRKEKRGCIRLELNTTSFFLFFQDSLKSQWYKPPQK